MRLLKHISIPKVAVLLMVLGVVFTILGFTMSGMNTAAYHDHPNRWYYIMDDGN
jgi:membrane-bound ClpP family serine protease